MNKALKALCEDTGTKFSEWEEIDGPITNVGVERWYKNKITNEEAYTCDDQGHITLELNEEE